MNHISIINTFRQKNGLEPVSDIESKLDGVFLIKGTIIINGRSYSGAGQGKKKQDARNRAYGDLYNKIKNLKIQKQETKSKSPSATVPLPKKPKTPVDVKPRDYISDLNEHCSKTKQPLPTYESWMSDDEFAVSCAIPGRGISKTGKGQNKKQAKFNAAKAVCESLDAGNSSQNKSASTSSFSALPDRACSSAQAAAAPFVKYGPALTGVKDQLKNGLRVVEKNIWFDPTKNINSGSSETKVYQGLFMDNVGNQKKVAVKQIPKSFDDDPKEVKLLLELEHINVIRYYFSEKENGGVTFLAMELAEETLETFVNENPGFEILKHILKQTVQGLKYLHNKFIVHRDIKPSNILLSNGVAKLADFGISKPLDPSKLAGTTCQNRGTLLWMPPEAFASRSSNQLFRIDRSWDIFSLGEVLFFSFSNGKHPLEYGKGEWNVVANKTTGAQGPQWKLIQHTEDPFALANLLQAMMVNDSNKRPNTSMILEHPFFWDDAKSIKFIVDFVNELQNCPRLNSFKQVLGEEYKLFLRKSLDIDLNWPLRLSPNVQKFLAKTNETRFKGYSATSFIAFIEFIRDKITHTKEWREIGLDVDEEFGQSEESFLLYFKKRVPELLTFLFLSAQIPARRDMKLKNYYTSLDDAYVFPSMMKSPLI